MIWHELRTMFARKTHETFFNVHRFSMSLMFLHFHYSIPCNVKMSYTSEILHVAVTSVNCSHFSYCTTTTLLMSFPPLLWTSCHLLLRMRELGAVVQCRSGDMTTLGLDGDVPSASAVGDRHQKIPAVSPSFYFKLLESPFKVHTLHLRGSFQFWINWVSSSMSNLTIQLNLIFYGVIFCLR